MSFRAKYPGRCPGCGDDIEVGDLLVSTDDGLYVHQDCPDASHPSSIKPRETCPRCFTEKSVSGACMCDPEDSAA